MRTYTVAEARALLPEVIPALEAIARMAKAMREHQRAVVAARRGVLADGALTADPWAEDDGLPDDNGSELDRLQAQFEAWGIELKDAERGLIDFYSERDGELIYLCYLLGEDTVRYWHTLSGGFAGRQPLEE